MMRVVICRLHINILYFLTLLFRYLSLHTSSFHCDKYTAMCQHSDTAQCNAIWISSTIHTNCWYFNPLLYLTSPLLTASHSTQSPLYNSNTYSNSWYIRLILFLGYRSLMVSSFTPWPLYLRGPLLNSLCGLLFRFARFWQQKVPCLCFISKILLLPC
jgi:hypothetical protein